MWLCCKFSNVSEDAQRILLLSSLYFAENVLAVACVSGNIQDLYFAENVLAVACVSGNMQKIKYAGSNQPVTKMMIVEFVLILHCCLLL